MRYSEDKIDEIKRKNDIVDVIGSYVNIKKHGSNYVGLCPFHDEKTPSFSVNANRQIFKCFGCGKGGSVITFIMEHEGMEFPEALKFLADRAGVELPQIEYTADQKAFAVKRMRMLDLYREAAYYYIEMLNTPQGKAGYDYLRKRELSDSIIKKFGLGFAPNTGSELYKRLQEKGFDDELIKASELFSFFEKFGLRDKFFNRVMFPIIDRNKKVIAFGGRVMTDEKPKYLNSNETIIFDKSRNLYALNLARSTKKDYFLLCEGYMDVIALYQAGFDNAVASLGTSLTEQQARLIARYVRKVIITYDSDGAGKNAARRAVPILKDAGISAKVIDLKPYKDPDEFIKALGREEYEKRIEDATAGFYYELSCIEAMHDMNDPADKTRFFNEAADEILKLEDALERSNYCDAVAKKYAVSPEEFKKLVNKKAAKIVPVEKKHKVFTTDYDDPADESLAIIPDRFEKEKLLLTWAMESKTYGRYLLELFEPEDFQEGIVRKAAEIAFTHLKKNNGVIEPSAVIDRFESTNEQHIVSELFQASVWREMGDNKETMDISFADAANGLMNEKISAQFVKATENNDGKLLGELMKKKKEMTDKTFYNSLLKRLRQEKEI